MLVALTGTPGTGKTALFRKILETLEFSDCSFSGVDLNSFIKEHGLITGEDAKRESHNVDIEKMRELIHEQFVKKTGSSVNETKMPQPTLILVEGHLSHLIDPDLCILLRCSPKVLWERLETRGYRKEKIRENLEAEALNIIRDEYLETCGGYGNYYEQFVSIYKHPRKDSSGDSIDPGYRSHPQHPPTASRKFSTITQIPLLELDTSHSSPVELTAVLAFLLLESLKISIEIKNLKTEKEPPSNSRRKTRSEKQGIVHITSNEPFFDELIRQTQEPRESQHPHQPGHVLEERRLEEYVMANYRPGIIDWSSEILTWY